jgi:hypothetical protein
VATKIFVAATHAHDRVPSDYWGCVYPAEVPSKSFSLQFALIISATGAELCFCMGSERREAGRPETTSANRRMLDEAQQQLANLPPYLIETVTQQLNDSWRFRKAWRQSARTTDFDSFAEWVQYAASPLGQGASVSCHFTPRALEKLGTAIVDRFAEMIALFAPVFEYIYTPETGDDDAEGASVPSVGAASRELRDGSSPGFPAPHTYALR